jgi:hypothetical protein
VLREELLAFGYEVAKYYASFKGNLTCRSIAKLNPQRKAIRFFLWLKASVDPDLKDTPATQNWADRYPSYLKINSERDLLKAKLLIERSNEEDCSRHEPFVPAANHLAGLRAVLLVPSTRR